MRISLVFLTCLIVFALSLGFSTVYAQTLQFEPDTIVTDHTSIISCIDCSDPTGGGTISVILADNSVTPPTSIPITLHQILGTNYFLSEPIKFTASTTTLGPNEFRLTPNTNKITASSSSAPDATATIENNFATLLDKSSFYGVGKKSITILANACSNTNQFTGGDTDGDLICDKWEDPTINPTVPDNKCPTAGLCIRTSATSPVYFLSCTSGNDRCPDKNRTDIYYEIDFMAGHKPSMTAINEVSNAFDNSQYVPACISGATCQNGVNLHIQLDEQLPHVNEIVPNGSITDPGFDQIKFWHFGTPQERGPGNDVLTNSESASWKSLRNVKAQVFHYMVFGHNLPGCSGNSCSSGHTEIPGNDVFITLGSFDNMIGTLDQQEGTLMHEIGHNINLDHGGNTPENCNPNYLSVMSYSRQFSDLVNRPLDYSHKKLSDIDEQSLPDNLGQSFIPNQDIVFQTPHGLGYWRAGSSPPIPWGVSPPSFNVNNLSSAPDTGCSDPDSPADVLAGFNDWDPLRLKITARTSTTNWRD